MGYTHYWYKQSRIQKSVMQKIASDFKKVLPEFKDLLCFEFNEPNKKPVITNALIRFNGKGKDGHETLYFEQVVDLNQHFSHDNGLIFGFCKTARKPYDIAVTTFLIIAAKHLKDGIRVTSDGNESEWQEAKDLCQKTLGYGNEFKLKGE